jgi:AAA family ATP:ADP antiporter
MLNAWAFTALTQGLGLGLAAVAVVGACVAALWALTGVYLGRQFNRMQPPEDATNSLAEVK